MELCIAYSCKSPNFISVVHRRLYFLRSDSSAMSNNDTPNFMETIEHFCELFPKYFRNHFRLRRETVNEFTDMHADSKKRIVLWCIAFSKWLYSIRNNYWEGNWLNTHSRVLLKVTFTYYIKTVDSVEQFIFSLHHFSLVILLTNKKISKAQIDFNFIKYSSRMVIDIAYSLLKKGWRLHYFNKQSHLPSVAKIITAACFLHNICTEQTIRSSYKIML